MDWVGEEYFERRRFAEKLYPHFNFWEIGFLVRTEKSYTEAWVNSSLAKKDVIERLINKDVAQGKREGWLQHFDAIELQVVGGSLIMKPIRTQPTAV